jgi:hypothetical protein
MQEAKFVVVWSNGDVSLADNNKISRMYDLSDCDAMDEVAGVYAPDEYCRLVPLTLGKVSKSGGAGAVRGYSYLFAGKRRAGTVHWTDH